MEQTALYLKLGVVSCTYFVQGVAVNTDGQIDGADPCACEVMLMMIGASVGEILRLNHL
jgi:hypothetical protein